MRVICPHRAGLLGISALINCLGVVFSGPSVPASLSVSRSPLMHHCVEKCCLPAFSDGSFCRTLLTVEILIPGFIFAILFSHSSALLYFCPFVRRVL